MKLTDSGFTDAPFNAGGSLNSIVDGSFTTQINALGFWNISGFHNLNLLNPLIVSGSSAADVAFISDDGQPAILSVGSGQADGQDDAVYTSILGSELSVNNPNANLSVMQTSETSGGHMATLDLAGLNFFNCSVSNILVGHDFGVPITRPTGTLLLAASNSITARMISVADAYQNAGGTSFIHLGQGNILNVDRIKIATHKCVGTVDFTPGLISPSATFRSSAGAGRQLSWEVGDEFEPDTSLGFYTSNQSTGIMDLTGGIVDAEVDRITLGRGQIDAPTRTGDGNGTLTFGGGVIDANTLEMGIQLSGGGSVGHGVLNVNLDDGVTPGILTVRSNVVMAVQLAGNTDANGSTAVINLNGGILAVAGDITDGAGLSTININTGGLLDLKPAGDDSAGNLSVDILNVSDGVLTNYNILSVSNLIVGGSLTEFTVYPGQSLAPRTVGTIGKLTVTGDLALRGTTLMDISKTGSALAADRIAVSGALDLGGALTVTLAGNNNLAIGNKFTLFSAARMSGSFTTLNLPSPGPGLGWTNKILVDGSIAVIASGEPAAPPSLSMVNTPTGLNLSWPVAYTSFVLRGQTNATGVGLTTNWGLVPGVAGNQVTIPRNLGNGSVFFELFHP